MPLSRSNSLKLATGIVVISIVLSAWIFLSSDFKTKQLLMSKEWSSRIVTLIEQDLVQTGPVEQLRRVDVISNVKYLPNHTYIRVSTLKVYSDITVSETTINISETGTWALSDDYLLVSPKDFKDVSTNQSREFTQDQLEIVTQLFKMEAQQSRRIDIVDNNTLLLTSLNHDSVTLFARNSL